jgi:hypothetical protein
MASFLPIYLAKARKLRWRVISSGDFNSSTEDKELGSRSSQLQDRETTNYIACEVAKT